MSGELRFAWQEFERLIGEHLGVLKFKDYTLSVPFNALQGDK